MGPWPFLVALAVLLFGLSLFWAANEDNETATVPVLAGTAALLVMSTLAWGIEARSLARDPERSGTRLAPRHTQAITFVIPEGKLAEARASDGILGRIEGAEGALRDHPGFCDLRVSVSPDDGGGAQALVETVWASREDFAGYEAGRDSLLNLIAEADDQVLAGSVQAFDLDVVRDTKEPPPRFTLFHGVAVLTALVIGGFVVGIIAGLVDEGGGTAVAADGAASGGGADETVIIATDNKFDKQTLTAPPNTEVTFTIRNEGAVLHNLAFYTAKGGELLSDTARGEFIEGGGTESKITFTTPGPGEYYFQCDLHPTEMFGTFKVEEGAGGAGSGGGGEADVVATEFQFSVSEIRAKAGEPFTITFRNEGQVLHNLAFLSSPTGEPLAEGAVGEFVGGGEGYTLTFTPPKPGTYTFICQIHPQMVGTFVVE